MMAGRPDRIEWDAGRCIAARDGREMSFSRLNKSQPDHLAVDPPPCPRCGDLGVVFDLGYSAEGYPTEIEVECPTCHGERTAS